MPASDDAPLGVGIIGCGAAAQTLHLPVLAALGDRFRVRHLVDASSTVARQLGARLGARHGTDHLALLDDESVDVAIIAAPDRFHGRFAVDACRAGKRAVLVEKPLALTPGEADAVVAASAEHDVPVLVGTMHRYDPAFIWALDRMPEQTDAVLFETVYGNNVGFINDAVALVTGAPDRTDGEAGLDYLGAALSAGGIDADPNVVTATALSLALSCHDFPLLRATLGEPTNVEYAGALAGVGWQAVIDYSGTKATLFVYESRLKHVSWRAQWLSAHHQVEVRFPETFEAGAATEAEIRRSAGDGLMTERYSAHHVTGFRREWEHLYRVVMDGEAPLTPASDAARDVHLAARCVRASANRAEAIDDPTRLAIAGSGWITAVHAPIIDAMPDATVSDVLSRDIRHAERRAWTVGATPATFGSLSGVIGRDDVDALLVAGPPSTHAEHAIVALDRYRHVIMEKPLTTTLADADRVIAAEGPRARILYAENWAYAPIVQQSLALACERPTNPADTIEVWCRHGRPEWGSFLEPWWGGGCLFDLGAHPMWWLLALAGWPDNGSVRAELHSDDAAATDLDARVHLSFGDGRQALLDVSWMQVGPLEVGIRVDGPGGALRAELEPRSSIAIDGVPLTMDRGQPHIAGWARKNGYVDQLRAAVAMVRDGLAPSTTAAEGRRVLDVISAAYRSAGTGHSELFPFAGPRDRTPHELWRRS